MTGIPFLSSYSIRAWQAEKRRLFSLSSYLGEGKRILRMVSLAKMRKGNLSASLRQKNDLPVPGTPLTPISGGLTCG